MAIRICDLESEGVVNADNWEDSHATCNGSHGLMQIGCIHGWDVEKLHIPEVNVRVAHDLYRVRGWYPWTTYKLLSINN